MVKAGPHSIDENDLDCEIIVFSMEVSAMWLITRIGFFSVVQKHGDEASGTLTVRARVRGDLETLREKYLPSLGPIQENVETDYSYLGTAPRAEVSSAMARMIADVNYSNLKHEVAKRQGQKRSLLYHEVWDVLYRLQTDRAFADD
jgi:hypothetical protein